MSHRLPFEQRCYKRWLDENTLLVLVRVDEPRCFRAVKYELTTGRITALHPDAEYSIAAPALPSSNFGTDGSLLSEQTMLLAPRLWLSPDRRRAVWLDVNDEWTTFNFADSAANVQIRPNKDRSNEDVVWFADSTRWGEAISSNTGRTIVEFDIYSTSGDVLEMHIRQRIRSGRCAGTTSNNTALIVSTFHDKETGMLLHSPVEITRLDLASLAVCAGRSRGDVPEGQWWRAVRLSPDGRCLAWELSERISDTKHTSLWLSDLDAREWRSLGIVAQKKILRSGYAAPIVEADNMDLEWHPNGRMLTYMSENTVHFVSCDR